MLLVFDVGNNQTVAGVFEGTKLVAGWRLATDKFKTPDEYGILLKGFFADQKLDPSRIKEAVISSSVPPVTGIFEKMVNQYFGVNALIVGPGVKTGLVIKYENPREIGADVIVNSVAGLHLYGPPLIIIDFGTASAFCAIAQNGDYLGGIIAPGIGISSEALFQRAAKLYRVELAKPKTVIGKNNIHSIQSGLIYGYIGLVEGLITRMKSEMNCNPKVIATGELAELVAGETKMIDLINPELTLEGLRVIYELNK